MSQAKKATKVAAPSQLSLSFSLAELPSSQHRAGLAGLVLLVKWLERVPGQKGLCVLRDLGPRKVTLDLDKEGLGRLFDALYKASKEEQARPQKLKKKDKTDLPPLREETREEVDEKTQKKKTKTVYIYPVNVPHGAFLVDYDPTQQNGNGLWIKLWRDFVWSILRGVPATREPFDARAEDRETKDVEEVWGTLCKPETYSIDLPSTYFLGAQATTAELVPFMDRARYQFLLHFWPLAAQLYVPATLNNEGKREFAGFAVAIPDVADLELFCEEYPPLLKQRGDKKNGYRPAESVVDFPLESALDLAHRLYQRIALQQARQSTHDALLGVDVFHLEKQGNNIRLWSVGRLSPSQASAKRYAALKDSLWDYLFRRQRLLNLLSEPERPWFAGFDRLLATTPEDQTIKSQSFCRDAQKVFTQEFPMEKDTDLNTTEGLSALLYQFVGNYLNQRLDLKYDLKWEKAKVGGELLKDYNEKRLKLAREAFFAIRSRSDADFVDYFTTTLCAVPHFLPPDRFAALTRALLEQTGVVRAITLVALSGHSNERNVKGNAESKANN